MTESKNKPTSRRLPEWLKRPMPSGEKFGHVMKILKEKNLATVCSSAHCPNQGECYSCGTATFMIMGEVCTRNCQFCAVTHGEVGPLGSDEPTRLAEAVQLLELKHVVITSVTRDDLPDGGANHFAATIQAIRHMTPKVTIEVLTPDFKGQTDCLDIVCAARPDVFNHNVETSRRLTPEIRSGANYELSLGVLKYMANHPDGPIVKSGFMLGLGETDEEITEMLRDLHDAGVKMITIGQYLRPGPTNWPVHEYYRPEKFEAIKKRAEEIGFSHVAAGPFVRSSYHAELSLRDSAGNMHKNPAHPKE